MQISMREIKLTIDGKEVALTKEQIKALGIEVDDGCVCDKSKSGEYYFVDSHCHICAATDDGSYFDKMHFERGNYYRSKEYAIQVAMHQMLNNLLRRYSEQHGGDAEWDYSETSHFYILFGYESYKVLSVRNLKHMGVIYFRSLAAATQAIEEVVKPFMKEHPDFVW